MIMCCGWRVGEQGSGLGKDKSATAYITPGTKDEVVRCKVPESQHYFLGNYLPVSIQGVGDADASDRGT